MQYHALLRDAVVVSLVFVILFLCIIAIILVSFRII